MVEETIADASSISNKDEELKASRSVYLPLKFHK